MSRPDVYGTFGDATLTHADLKLLDPPNWINDNLITFYIEYLKRYVCEPESNIVILPPNLVFFLSMCQGIPRLLLLGPTGVLKNLVSF